MKIVSLSEKEIESWTRQITVEHEGKEYSGYVTCSEDGLELVLFNDVDRDTEAESALWDLVTDDYDVVCTDEVIEEKKA